MNKIPSVIFLILGFLVGFVLCELYIINFDFSFNNEINLQGIVSTIITIILTVYVVRKLNKIDDGEKIEKNILIKYIDCFDSDFTDNIRKISVGGQKYVEVVEIIKRYHLRIKHIIKLSKEQRFLESDSKIDKIFDEKISNIKELLTNTPRDGEIADGITLDTNNRLRFSSNQQFKIANSLYETRNLIFNFIVEINRSNRK